MNAHKTKNAPQSGGVAQAPEAPNSEFYGDWFHDELMTSSPEAMRDYLRARMLQPARAPTRR